LEAINIITSPITPSNNINNPTPPNETWLINEGLGEGVGVAVNGKSVGEGVAVDGGLGVNEGAVVAVETGCPVLVIFAWPVEVSENDFLITICCPGKIMTPCVEKPLNSLIDCKGTL